VPAYYRVLEFHRKFRRGRSASPGHTAHTLKLWRNDVKRIVELKHVNVFNPRPAVPRLCAQARLESAGPRMVLDPGVAGPTSWRVQNPAADWRGLGSRARSAVVTMKAIAPSVQR
jgi:hypothetical protein